MIMGRTGGTIYDLMRSGSCPTSLRIDFDSAIGYAINVMVLVQKLHQEAKIVHGDIHFGNIAFRSSENLSAGLLLLDFGRSFSVADTDTRGNELPEKVNAGYQWSDYLLSPWEIAGYRTTRRDDIFRVLLMLSYMLNGRDGIEAAKSLDSKPREAYEWRMTGDVFNGGMTRQQQSSCFEGLMDALNIVRAIEIDAEPDYGAIIGKLQNTEILDNSTTNNNNNNIGY